MVHLARAQCCPMYPVIDPELAQTNCSFRCQHLHSIYLAVVHPPPPQNCCVLSSTSSWPTPVREARHGRGGRYCALYSVHMGVPVQQKNVSHESTKYHEWLHILKEDVVPNRMSYAGRVPDRISFCQTTADSCISQGLPLYSDAFNAVLTDRRQYTQAAGTRPTISQCLRKCPQATEL